jgi:hypothetical protein
LITALRMVNINFADERREENYLALILCPHRIAW